MSREKRIGRSYNANIVDQFKNLIDELELIDIPMVRGGFTYQNFKEEEAFNKLDRFLMAQDILNRLRTLL